jgi:hypothetical protein
MVCMDSSGKPDTKPKYPRSHRALRGTATFFFINVLSGAFSTSYKERIEKNGKSEGYIMCHRIIEISI